MKKILKISGKGKVRKRSVPEAVSLSEYGVIDSESKMTLIQELIPLG